EWVDVDVPTPPRGEAARDRFHVAKQLARQLGASVTTVRSLEQLPPPGATLVIGTRRWSMFPGREAALRRWIEAGGHLVIMQSAWSADGETPGWVPMRSDRPRRHGATPAAVDAAASERDGAEDVVRRGTARFGPLVAAAGTARRAIGEQVRRPAAFIAAGDGAALHRASVRALEEEARRSIPGYATLLGARERSESLARRVRADPAALAA